MFREFSAVRRPNCVGRDVSLLYQRFQTEEQALMSFRNRHSEPESHMLVFTSAPIFFVAKENFYPKKGNDESSKIQPRWTAIRPQNQNFGEMRVVFVLSIFAQKQPKAWHSQNILCGSDKVSNKQRVYFLGCCEGDAKSPTTTARTGRCPT